LVQFEQTEEAVAQHLILIVENHALLRAGLRALLSANPDVEVVGEAANGHDAIRAARTLQPTLILMDISMPGMNGIEAMIDIKRRQPAVRVIVITIHREDEYIHASLRAGADGYLLKDASNDEFQVAVRTVSNGQMYLSPAVSGDIVQRYLGANDSQSRARTKEELSHRERQVLKLIAEGHRNKYIAEYFSLSIRTIEKHRSNLMQKLDLHNSSMLTSYAIEHGLLQT
jgi:DNA-binding NarL/FixJ family response regulator